MAAGATLGDKAGNVAATVKMIQNILIGVSAFGIATYWVTSVEPLETKSDPDGEQKANQDARPRVAEIWLRIPRFIIGFVLVSILFSLIHGCLDYGPELVEKTVKGSTKGLRGWCFCLAFVAIGLSINIREMAGKLKGGKPLVLYLCGQTLNLVLTLLMAYLMFGVLFPPEDG